MNYKTEITGIGDMAVDLLAENMLIVFNENAPEELREIAHVHTSCPLDQDVAAGDAVTLGNREYAVCEVGEEANRTLRGVGHCTFLFGSANELLPGCIRLDGETAPDVKVGDAFEIKFA